MLDKRQYQALSEFRHAMAGFLQFSQQTTHAAGLTPAQYQMLLHLQAFPGRDWATISELAERMQSSHPATAALVKRAQKAGLVTKQRGREDGRCVEIHATPLASSRCSTCRHRGAPTRTGRSSPTPQRRRVPHPRAASGGSAGWSWGRQTLSSQQGSSP